MYLINYKTLESLKVDARVLGDIGRTVQLDGETWIPVPNRQILPKRNDSYFCRSYNIGITNERAYEGSVVDSQGIRISNIILADACVRVGGDDREAPVARQIAEDDGLVIVKGRFSSIINYSPRDLISTAFRNEIAKLPLHAESMKTKFLFSIDGEIETSEDRFFLGISCVPKAGSDTYGTWQKHAPYPGEIIDNLSGVTITAFRSPLKNSLPLLDSKNQFYGLVLLHPTSKKVVGITINASSNTNFSRISPNNFLVKSASDAVECIRLQNDVSGAIEIATREIEEEKNVRKREVKNIESRIEELQKALLLESKNYKKSSAILYGLENASTKEQSDMLIKQLEELKNSLKIKSAWLTKNGLSFTTDPLYAFHPKNRTYHAVGEYIVSINFMDHSNRLVKCHQLDRTKLIDGGRQGLHLNAYGEACLGDLEVELPPLIRNRDILGAGLLCLSFLEQVNLRDGWGAHIKDIPVTPVEQLPNYVELKKEREKNATNNPLVP